MKTVGSEILRDTAFEKIDDQEVFEYIAKHSEFGKLRCPAIEKIDNQVLLENIIKNIDDEQLRISAVKRITNQDLLKKLAEDDESILVCYYAAMRLNGLNIHNFARTHKNDLFKIYIINISFNVPFLEEMSRNPNTKVSNAAKERLRKIE